MNIVVLERDSVGNDIDFTGLEAFGPVTEYGLTDAELVPERIRDAEVVVVNKLPMNEKTLGAAHKLRLICLTATGSNNIDRDYTNSRGITVANVAGYSTDSVAQHTFAMLLYLWEQMPYFDRYVKTKEYCKSPIFCNLDVPFHELAGRTFGIIGLGAIGQKVAQIAASFGCRVIYYSTSGNHDHPLYERTGLEELLSRSDIVSIHAPLNDATYHLMTKERFRQMKSSAILLNLGRGDIVDEGDLVWALDQGEIFAAGLDVISREPMEPDNVLLTVKDPGRLLVTPHVAWGTIEARQRVVDEVCKNIQAFLDGVPRNIIR